MNDKRIKRDICNFLLSMKMKNTAIGLCYWITAIDYYILLIQADRYQVIRMNDIYNFVAKKHCTTVDCAEKAMRYAKKKCSYQEILNVKNELKNFDFLILCGEYILENVSQNAVVDVE